MRPVVEPGPELTRAQLQRYSRHILLGPIGRDGQRRLLHARVAVVGAGGLGAPVIQYLAAAGIGRLTVIDDDVVEASNLQRQVIHSQATLGRPKATSAAEAASSLNPDVTVTARQVRLEQANATELLGGHDLVIDGTDNFPTRYLISDVCAELGLPVVWGSILRFDAQVSVFWAGEAAEPQVTLRDLFPHPPDEGTTPSCGEAGVLGAMCGQVGSVMATEAIKLLTGAGQTLLGRILVLDALTQRWREIPLQPPAAPRDERSRGAFAADPPPKARIVEDPPAEVPAIDVLELQRRLAARDRSGPSTVLIDVREAPSARSPSSPAPCTCRSRRSFARRPQRSGTCLTRLSGTRRSEPRLSGTRPGTTAHPRSWSTAVPASVRLAPWWPCAQPGSRQ